MTVIRAKTKIPIEYFYIEDIDLVIDNVEQDEEKKEALINKDPRFSNDDGQVNVEANVEIHIDRFNNGEIYFHIDNFHFWSCRDAYVIGQLIYLQDSEPTEAERREQAYCQAKIDKVDMKNIPVISKELQKHVTKLSEVLNKHITKFIHETPNEVDVACCCNDIMTEVFEVKDDKRIIVLSVEVPRFPMVDDELFEIVHKMADGEIEYQFDYLGKRNPTPK